MVQFSPTNDRYLLISPCRNEAGYVEATLESVISQSVWPAKWVIVDDGSTDDTPRILEEYRKKYQWIDVVTRDDRGHRAVGPGVIDAFYAGYETIEPAEYEYVCKLDLDLKLPEQYFERLISKMKDDPLLATCSGKAYFFSDGILVPERHGDDTSFGATKFYRTDRFSAIGGFVREVMWDGIDCHMCRMRGWKARSWDDPELRFEHLRPMGSSQQGILKGRYRYGFGQYFMGTGFLYMLASATIRVTQKPFILGSVMMLCGWLISAVKRLPRYPDPEFRAFLRSYHWQVMLYGKERTLKRVHERNKCSSS